MLTGICTWAPVESSSSLSWTVAWDSEFLPKVLERLASPMSPGGPLSGGVSGCVTCTGVWTQVYQNRHRKNTISTTYRDIDVLTGVADDKQTIDATGDLHLDAININIDESRAE